MNLQRELYWTAKRGTDDRGWTVVGENFTAIGDEKTYLAFFFGCVPRSRRCKLQSIWLGVAPLGDDFQPPLEQVATWCSVFRTPSASPSPTPLVLDCDLVHNRADVRTAMKHEFLMSIWIPGLVELQFLDATDLSTHHRLCCCRVLCRCLSDL